MATAFTNGYASRLHTPLKRQCEYEYEYEHNEYAAYEMDAPVVVHDAWTQHPLAPGVWDLELEKHPDELDNHHYSHSRFMPLPMPTSSLGLLVTPPSRVPSLPSLPALPSLSVPSLPVMMPPTPRPASLELAACDPHCFPPRDATPEANDAEMEIVDDEDCRRGRSPGRAPLPFAAVCPPAPRLDGAELEGANPGPTPPRFCTRPPLARGYSALGLDLTSVSPLSPAPSSSPTQQYHAKSVSPPRSFPTRIPMQRRAKSDDLHSRIHTWSSAVARANPIHGAPVHASRPTHRSRTSLSPSDVHNQLDPWAARIGRSRGRTVDMPTARKQW